MGIQGVLLTAPTVATTKQKYLKSWFEARQEKLQTDKQRKKNLGYMKNFELMLGCWHCWCKDCTEAWECKGYLALIRGQDEKADKCFERADVCALRRNDDVRRERLRLRRRRSRT